MGELYSVNGPTYIGTHIAMRFFSFLEKLKKFCFKILFSMWLESQTQYKRTRH